MDDGEVPFYDPAENIVIDWEEGTEAYKDFTPEQLWSALGLGDTKVLPFFNTQIDPDNVHHRWTEEGRAFFDDSKRSKIPLEPHWHQLGGILKMLELAFSKKPTLLMDEVGVGKTLQVVGIIAMIAYFREFYAFTGSFPGKFSKFSLPSVSHYLCYFERGHELAGH
jgi:hypothetical protein